MVLQKENIYQDGLRQKIFDYREKCSKIKSLKMKLDRSEKKLSQLEFGAIFVIMMTI